MSKFNVGDRVTFPNATGSLGSRLQGTVVDVEWHEEWNLHRWYVITPDAPWQNGPSKTVFYWEDAVECLEPEQRQQCLPGATDEDKDPAKPGLDDCQILTLAEGEVLIGLNTRSVS